MILSAYKNYLDQLDLNNVASDFINKNDAHKHIFCKFNLWLVSMYIAYLYFLFIDIFDVKKIQNVTSFLRTFYVPYHFKVLRFCTHLCFRLLFEYSHVS